MPVLKFSQTYENTKKCPSTGGGVAVGHRGGSLDCGGCYWEEEEEEVYEARSVRASGQVGVHELLVIPPAHN